MCNLGCDIGCNIGCNIVCNIRCDIEWNVRRSNKRVLNRGINRDRRDSWRGDCIVGSGGIGCFNRCIDIELGSIGWAKIGWFFEGTIQVACKSFAVFMGKNRSKAMISVDKVSCQCIDERLFTIITSNKMIISLRAGWARKRRRERYININSFICGSRRGLPCFSFVTISFVFVCHLNKK